ncbi:ABC transporter ATP-binding protein [Halomonas sp.]|uniref:ABC transporter ATP-binding protein n=1 Tax=Halomonas sp. TaxID=1486246 RepID=UPI003F909449
MPIPALAIEGLQKSFGDKKALDGIDLHLSSGKVLALLGPSGCGKTTLLRCIAGLTGIDSGHISLNGQLVAQPQRHLSPNDRKLGMVFQDYALWPHMSVAQNVAFPLEMQGVNPKAREEQVAWALSLVGLGDYADRQPGSLSGGQQQRVALARAIVAKPRLLLMDEPLSNLDKGLRDNLALEIRALIEELALTAVFVTHDQHEAFSLADEVAVLQAGRLQQVASPEALYQAPATPSIAAFIDAGAVLDGHFDADGFHVAGQTLRVMAHRDYTGPARLLLPRRALTLTSPTQADVIAKVKGRLFQGDHTALTLSLNQHTHIKLRVHDTLVPPESVGLTVDVASLRAWLPTGEALSCSPLHAAELC